MKRYSGQRALYEAMQRVGRRRAGPGLLERLTPKLEKVGRLAKSVIERPKLMIRQRGESAPETPAPAVLKPPRPVERHEPPVVKAGPAQTLFRPKAVQFNAGRIEVSLPWQLGVVIGLLVIVAVLVIYQLGQIDERARYEPQDTSRAGAAVKPVGPETSRQNNAAGSAEPSANRQAEVQSSAPTPAAGGKCDHVIVLAQYRTREDLEPVKEFFEKNGITATILSYAMLRDYFQDKDYLNANVVPKGDGFMLVSGLCENPEVSGTNGYAVKQKIIELGAQYKAPNGFESFAKHHFSDAYGMRVK